MSEPSTSPLTRLVCSLGFWIFALGLALSFFAGRYVAPTWQVQKAALEADELNTALAVPVAESKLWAQVGVASRSVPMTEPELVYQNSTTASGESVVDYFQLSPRRHWGAWSLMPALVAVALCFITREPVTALSGGILAGALLMQQYDITGQVLIPELGTKRAAVILVLYLWFLGGLMGMWSRNGAALAFAQLVTRVFVRGPVSARLVAWGLGVAFFQGGTMSTVLVGTTVRPVADKEKISHEELSYIVDSTASPIAILLPFNAWPYYVQSLIFLGGVGFLATEADRMNFFYQNMWLYFYAIFAVTFTFLLCFDKLPFLSPAFKRAIARARETGQLNRPGSKPLMSRELESADVPEGYRPSVWEFFIPLGLIIGISIGTFIGMGSAKVLWGFAAALVVSFGMTLFRGMSLSDAIEGFNNGLKGVVYGSVILLLAIVVGQISSNTGGGIYLVDLLGGKIPYWLVPVILQLLTMIIAFSTGTSWGTFAVSLPLVMPLAWSTAITGGMAHPELYLSVCFAAVINGSVYGDQCSPISDTTVLSSMATGTDLMDHVKTQLFPASVAAGLAAIGWTLVALYAG